MTRELTNDQRRDLYQSLAKDAQRRGDKQALRRWTSAIWELARADVRAG